MSLRALAAAAAVAVAAPAAANPHATFIDATDEEDLDDLEAAGLIDPGMRDALVEAMQRGVDLNRATRDELYGLPNLTYAEVDAILDYRARSGWIDDPLDLVASGVLSPARLEAIAAFLVATDPLRPLAATDGWLRGQTRWSAEDDGAPPAALQLRLATLRHLTVGGAAVLSRNGLGGVESFEGRAGDALSAVEAGARVDLPKLYAAWETDGWGLIAGSYRIGFAQRLAFDNTSLDAPNGFTRDGAILRDATLVRACRESAADPGGPSPCAGSAAYETPDYRWSDGLFGAALRLRLDAGRGSFQVHAFGSHQRRSIDQYEIVDATACAAEEGSAACEAPAVYHREPGAAEPTGRFRYATLPGLYTESILGGNATYSFDRRSHLGATAYGAEIDWLPGGIELDFRDSSRLPAGGRFGAVGVDGSFGRGAVDLAAEVARSVDSAPEGGGGLGALVRAALAGPGELEASLRYYGEGFDNPYAHPIAAPDEVGGARARDEMGARLRYSARPTGRLGLRGLVDLWSPTSAEDPAMQLDARADLGLSDEIGVDLGARYDRCLASASDGDPAEPICDGETLSLGGRVRLTAPRVRLTAQYQHEILAGESRQDGSAVLVVAAEPAAWLRARLRVRYLSEDIGDDSSLEESVWTYADLGVRLRGRDWLTVRYDVYAFLDDRESTRMRASPEHWLWFDYEARF